VYNEFDEDQRNLILAEVNYMKIQSACHSGACTDELITERLGHFVTTELNNMWLKPVNQNRALRLYINGHYLPE
jgi:hypothetical protein